MSVPVVSSPARSSSVLPGLVAVSLLATGIAAAGAPPVFEDEITVTVTGAAETTDGVPTPATVVTREEMDDAQADTVADVLRRVPGVTVARSGGEGSAASLFVRGTESNHTLVLFDGVRLNSPYFAGYDWGQATTVGLERLEVVRGPYSALWGADAIGGVVNMIPARGSRTPRADLAFESGDDAWERLEGSMSWGGERADLFVAGFDREGEGALDNSDFTTRQILADIGWRLGREGRIGVVVQDLESETGIPFATPGVPSPNRRQWSEQQLVAVPMTVNIDTDWSVDIQASVVERDFRFRDPDDPFLFTSSDVSADTLQARLASRHSLGRHTLTWGAEVREDEVDDVSSFGVNLEAVTIETTSAFVQDEWHPGRRLRVIAGARLDDSDAWGAQVSPRVNLGWQVGDNLELRLGFGEAFRQPSAGELHFPFSGNPELDPETSTSYEVGLVYRASGRGTRWQVNLFTTEIEQLIDFDLTSYRFANVQRAEIDGAELAIDALLTKSISSSLHVTFLDTTGANDEALLRRPVWSGSLTLRGALSRHLRGDISVTWVGERDDVDPTTYARTKNDSHLATNIALAYRLWESTELTLRIVNVTDRSYQEVLGYPAPRRRVVTGLRWRL